MHLCMCVYMCGCGVQYYDCIIIIFEVLMYTFFLILPLLVRYGAVEMAAIIIILIQYF